jgi:DNA-binding transcriptional MerR regulator
MTGAVYQLADVAAILGMQKSHIKNWTIGRPFSVRASLRSSSGKGSRNLFTRNDVNRFALVRRFHEIGAPVPAIQQMLDELSPELDQEAVWKASKEKTHWVVISREECGHLPYCVYLAVSFPAISSRLKDDFTSFNSGFCFYAVKLGEVENTVSSKIHSLEHDKNKKSGPQSSASG